MTHFNPRSPRGGATPCRFNKLSIVVISIHAPHEGERHSTTFHLRFIQQFQSTLPTRGSDAIGSRAICVANSISIHAPHEGERLIVRLRQCLRTNFNPRSPRGGATNNFFHFYVPLMISIHAPHEGERPRSFISAREKILFQSTLPTRGSDTGQKYF